MPVVDVFDLEKRKVGEASLPDAVFAADKVLLLDNVEDPHNVGAILRSAEIFGFHDIVLPLKGVPEIYPSIVKVSAGATEHLRIARSEAANAYVKRAKNEGRAVIALDEEGTMDLAEAARNRVGRILLVIGGEGDGLSKLVTDKCDFLVAIPQYGQIGSLNAGVAAGILMFEKKRQDAAE